MAKSSSFLVLDPLDLPDPLLYTLPMQFIVYLQAVIAVLLIMSIVMQSRGTGLSATFGGTDTSFVQRRGAERVLYQGTIVLSIAFFALTLLDWFI